MPGLEGQGRSEGLVLKRTVDYMRQQVTERRELVDRIEQAGGHVDEDLKKYGLSRDNLPFLFWPMLICFKGSQLC